MGKRIVILNCPPRSGKDTIAEEFVKRHNFGMMSFKYHLKKIALLISAIPLYMWDHRYEREKDKPWELLNGLSQRQYLIKISEEWVKPLHGKEYFGQRVVEDISRSGLDSFILPDGGFKEEMKPVLNEYGPNSVLILQWGRAGSSFDNDSRDWVTDFPEVTRKMERDNDTTIEDHYMAVKEVIDEYFK